MFEVEQKFRVSGFESVNAALDQMAAGPPETIIQIDRYLRHPSRDFASTDEALRLRRVGEQNFITYKGPKIDAETKTRHEIELPMTSGAEWLESYTQLMQRLSFEVVTEVEKNRTKRHINFQSHDFEVALDEVKEVGLFVELETEADEAGLDSAREAMSGLAAELGLSEIERTSYLGLLLAARGETS